MDTPQIGFIGLGLMGAPMAANLLKAGYTVTVWNRTTAKMKPLVELGAIQAENPADVARRSSIIITIVTDTPQVREVVFGEHGIVHGAHRGTILIDCSTISPSAVRAIADDLHPYTMVMLDAPVSGGPEGAKAGTLSIMVGGDEAVFQSALPVLQAMGRTIRFVGAQGSGQLVKICNQIACAMNMLGMCEAMTMASRGGIDLNIVREILMGGAAGSWMMENWAPKIIDRKFTPGFSVANCQKDLRSVLQEAASLHVALPGTAVAFQLNEACQAAGNSSAGTTVLYKLLMQLAGEEF
ncbi:MAG TPA: NAD(P)-dependent oxidoreductase [Armatimonadota bacterium]|nr:NAD(P)-dependent oxidoreductase [Armatimonadota bacterium]